MKWLSDRLHQYRARRSTTRSAAPAPSPPAGLAHSYQHHPPPQDDARLEATNARSRSESADLWTTAYDEALSQLDGEVRELLSREEDLEAAFARLSEANDAHKSQSISRRAVEKVQIPLNYFNTGLSIANPLAGLDPASSAAFGIVQSVTTLAIGICGVEERLNQLMAQMLEQIKVIDECDTVGQKLGDGATIHTALVRVYGDLLAFYHAVVQMLTKKSTALALLSEQLNERLPPVVEDFLRHASQLNIHISNATAEMVKSIETMLIDTKIRQLLGSRKLAQLDRMHQDFQKRTARDACTWVTENREFCKWYQGPATQTLVLTGEMGSGKTIMMSFMIDQVHLSNRKQIPSALICYHYCCDDETGNTLSVFSTLIQQLMRQKPRLKVQFDSWCDDRRLEGNQTPTQDSGLLASFFFNSVRSLERPLFLFIDGLDECDDRSREELVTSLKKHSLTMTGLKICLSARYQAQIRGLENSPRIRIDKDSRRDAVIVSHMVNSRLPWLEPHPEARKLVIEKLSDLANGSPIWVRMAVDLLETRKIQAIGKLRSFLREELPESELSDLYAKLFSQITKDDDDNAKFLSTALEVLAVAERPLSVLELSWAVALGDIEADAKAVQDLEDYVEVDRLMNFLGPFIANFQSDAHREHQLRLVHQSLREIILQSSPRHWTQLQHSATKSNVTALERRQELHGKMARGCVQYLHLSEIGEHSLFSDEQDVEQTLIEFPGLDLFGDDPVSEASNTTSDIAALAPNNSEPSFSPIDRGFGEMFTYASCYWLHHMRRADDKHGLGLCDVIALTTSGTKRSQNWWEQFHRPDCTLKPDASQTRPEWLESLTIVSLYGPESLFQELLQNFEMRSERKLSPPSEQRKHAVNAILRQGDPYRLPSLIRYNRGESLQEAMDLFIYVLQDWSRRKRYHPSDIHKFDEVFDHMTGAFDIMTELQWGNEMLCLASSYGCLPMVTRMFTAAKNNPGLKREILRSPHRDGGKMRATVHHQSIGDASWNGHSDVVAFLLKQDGIKAHLQYRDVMGNNVFHKAARSSDSRTFELLLSRFPEGVNEKNKDDDTPLQLLVFENRPQNLELVKLLLNVGHADVKCGHTELPSSWHEPIRMATRYCNLTMCQVLVQLGNADPMSVFKLNGDGELSFIDPLDKNDMVTEVRNTLLSLAAERNSRKA